MQLVFATQNANKLREIRPLLPTAIDLILPKDLGYDAEIPENEPTIEGNALLKAQFIYDRSGLPSFADDTGLEVDALGGQPGVYSARYGGKEKDPVKNIDRLLSELKDKNNRRAKFWTIIALVLDGKSFQFEGKIEGEIAEQRMGSQGFGYDPVFIPSGSIISFAQMSLAEKNRISHRAIAVRKFCQWLQVHLALG